MDRAVRRGCPVGNCCTATRSGIRTGMSSRSADGVEIVRTVGDDGPMTTLTDPFVTDYGGAPAEGGEFPDTGALSWGAAITLRDVDDEDP